MDANGGELKKKNRACLRCHPGEGGKALAGHGVCPESGPD
jgi:hypothetical protein